MENQLVILYLAGILGILAAGFFYVGLRWFEATIFIVALSPWISALFLYDMTKRIGISETTYGSYIRISLLLIAGAIGFGKYMQTVFKTHEKLPFEFKIMIAFICLALVSTFYSIDAFFTSIRAISSISFFLFLIGYYFWLTDIKKIEHTFTLLFWFIVFNSLANLAALFLLGNRVWMGTSDARFSGLWTHPNMMGSYCMISYPILYWKFLRSKLGSKIQILGLAAMMFLMHYLTGSRTSLLLSVFGITLYMLLQRNKMNFIIALLIGVFAGTVIITHTNFLNIFERKSEVGNSMTTLTGRTDIWEASFQLIKERPIEGYGYAVDGKIFSDYRFYNPKLMLWSGTSRLSLHNGFLSVAVGLGIFGLVMWIIILFLPYFKFLFFQENDFRPLLITLMSILFVSNLVEGSIDPGGTITAIFFWFAWAVSSKFTSTNLIQKQVNSTSTLLTLKNKSKIKNGKKAKLYFNYSCEK